MTTGIQPRQGGSLPGVAPSALPADAQFMDLVGLDGNSLGGVRVYGGTICAPGNSSGQALYYCWCPNNLTANQYSADPTGAIAFGALVICKQPLDSAPRTFDFELEMAVTKSGLRRSYYARSVSQTSNLVYEVTGRWADTTTPMTSGRIKAVLADGTTSLELNRFLATAGVAQVPGWAALGLP